MAKTYTLRQTVAKTDIPDYLSELNPGQLAAVLHRDGPALVIAGAGTGKTKTLTYRVSHLIHTGVPPQQILLLTFTRRAAQTMLERAASLFPSAASVTGGTFHSFAAQLLRVHGHHIGIQNQYTILDRSDAEDRIDIARNELLTTLPKKIRFPKKSTLQDLYSSSRNKGLSVFQTVEADYPQFIELTEQIQFVLNRFQEEKRKYQLVDYDDLLFYSLDLVKNHPVVRENLRSNYRYLMIDEYQDTNPVQSQLIEWIAGESGNIIVVGDDAQSIYQFRGADFRNFLDFPKRYPSAQVFKLEQNYRSTQPILDVSNAIIKMALNKFDKTLFSIGKEKGDLPAIIQAQDDQFQARFIVSKILDLREEGVPLNEIVVLFRNSRNSYQLEIELESQNIPYEKRGGIRFGESAHVKDILSYLKLAQNTKDVVSWNRVLRLIDGIGPKSADEIIGILSSGDRPSIPVSQRFATSVNDILKIIETIKADQLSLANRLELLIAHYRPFFENRYFEDFPKREKDFDALIAIIAQYGSIDAFLAAMMVDPMDITHMNSHRVQDDEPPVILSTIHSAKGLEWHSVFILDLLDGVLPSNYSLENSDEMDEELRLFYVAVTRAKQHLFLVYPVTRYHRQFKDYFAKPSRFLTQIPDDKIEKWVLEMPVPDRGIHD